MPTECLKINDLILSIYADFGFEEISVKLSTRPDKRVGTDAVWDHAEEIMGNVLKTIEAQSGGNASRPSINPGEGAFYGPKFEYVLKDAIGREWQCGTTQVDFNLPERFGAFYIGSDSEKKQPVMIHRAICGSMERFLGILIENYAGHLPLWFAPLQVVVATITSDADDYATGGRRATEGGRACWPRPTCATRRSTTRSASIRWPRFRSSSSAASAKRRRARSTSAGSARVTSNR